jgi:nitrogen fixation NifU-like protein
MNKDFDKLGNELQQLVDEEARKVYSEKVINHATHPENIGRMSNPDGAASVKGLCGDTIEMYLALSEDRVADAYFYTDGCGATVACGSVTTTLAKGRSIPEILQIAPADIIAELDGLPEENVHCAILSVSTLHKALADYLLKRQM